jgi:hypothetical protein
MTSRQLPLGASFERASRASSGGVQLRWMMTLGGLKPGLGLLGEAQGDARVAAVGRLGDDATGATGSREVVDPIAAEQHEEADDGENDNEQLHG